MNIAGLILYSLLSYVNSFIIPNEIPTILSIIYSNIPPIKIGVDTRFGLGFRLGERADYQTLIEIGPQTNTNPISGNGTVAKRQSITFNPIQRLYAEAARTAGRTAGKLEQRRKKIEKNKKSQIRAPGNIESNKVPGKVENINKLKSVDFKGGKGENTSETSPAKFSLL